jgi:hypothetical protein
MARRKLTYNQKALLREKERAFQESVCEQAWREGRKRNVIETVLNDQVAPFTSVAATGGRLYARDIRGRLWRYRAEGEVDVEFDVNYPEEGNMPLPAFWQEITAMSDSGPVNIVQLIGGDKLHSLHGLDIHGRLFRFVPGEEEHVTAGVCNKDRWVKVTEAAGYNPAHNHLLDNGIVPAA